MEKINRLKQKISKLTEQVSVNSYKQMTTVNEYVNKAVIPLFDPSAENLTVTQWVKKVDQLALQYGWYDLLTLKLATNRLRGNARKWYDTAHISDLNWNIIKELLKNNFPGTLKFGKLLVEAAVYTPHAKQNLGDYCCQIK